MSVSSCFVASFAYLSKFARKALHGATSTGSGLRVMSFAKAKIMACIWSCVKPRWVSLAKPFISAGALTVAVILSMASVGMLSRKT